MADERKTDPNGNLDGDAERPSHPFQIDLQAIRERAREHMSSGAVTGAYAADRIAVISVLNEALATEIVCVLRYKNHYFMARGIHAQSIAQEFLEHAGQEQDHADAIAARITQLGGVPNLNPADLATRSHSEYREGGDIEEMMQEDLVAERIAIETYSEIIRWLGNDDPTTRRMMEDILKVEEKHADDLANLLAGISWAAAAIQHGDAEVESPAPRH
jgi:bacterioferritin